MPREATSAQSRPDQSFKKPPGGEDSLKASIKTNAKKDGCRLMNFQVPSNFLLKKSPFFVGIVPLNMQIKSRRATSIIEFHMEMPNSKHEK